MKTRKGSKSRKGTQPRTKSARRVRSKTKAGRRPGALASASLPVPHNPPSEKVCEEVEVGDIGGFGDPEELEAHEKPCGEKPTEFCHACARNLCSSHYELLHRDHDTASAHNIVKGMTTSNQ